jgi:hypothetical protein
MQERMLYQLDQTEGGQPARAARREESPVENPDHPGMAPGPAVFSGPDAGRRGFPGSEYRSGFDIMRVFRRHRYLLSFLGLLVFCSVMVVLQDRRNQNRHVEIREAFILLYTKGYKSQADRLYRRLVFDADSLSNRLLEDDWQRTVLLVDPTANQPENLIWKYHWTISKELEKRSSSMLRRALDLAGEEK